MKTLQQLNAMTVEEIQAEMANANRNFDGDYQTIVENIMVVKEMEMIKAKELKKTTRKDLEELVLDLAKNLKNVSKEWTVGGYYVKGQLAHATVAKTWLKVWKKEHLAEIAAVLESK
jgi:ribosomal protein L29